MDYIYSIAFKTAYYHLTLRMVSRSLSGSGEVAPPPAPPTTPPPLRSSRCWAECTTEERKGEERTAAGSVSLVSASDNRGAPLLPPLTKSTEVYKNMNVD